MSGTVSVDTLNPSIFYSEILHGGDCGNSAILGDVTGDGKLDLLVGNPQASDEGNESGTVFLVSDAGSYSGSSNLDTVQYARFHADLTLGQGGYGHLGRGVTAVDIDGDSTEDVVMSAQFDDGIRDDGVSEAGHVYLFEGPITGGDHKVTDAGTTFIGEDGEYSEGYAFSDADTDGDGYKDLLVSAPTGGANSVYIIRGGLTIMSLGEVNLVDQSYATLTGSEEFGVSVAGAGNVDGDGEDTDDVLVGQPSVNTAYLFLGPITGVVDSSTAAVRFEGESSTDNAGSAVASVGDPNGDGLSDILIGAYTASGNGAEANGGAAYLLFGNELPLR